MCSKKYIYANLHKIIRFCVVSNEITTIYNKKRGFPFLLENLSSMSGRQDSNLRPPGPKPGALPDCATPRSDLASAKVDIKFETSKFFFVFFTKY